VRGGEERGGGGGGGGGGVSEGREKQDERALAQVGIKKSLLTRNSLYTTIIALTFEIFVAGVCLVCSEAAEMSAGFCLAN